MNLFSRLRSIGASAFLSIISVTGVAQQAAPPEAPSAQASQASATAPAEFAQARKLIERGKIDEAIAQLQTVEGSAPATKGLALELGIAYYRKNDFSKAIEYLKKAIAADPANGEPTQLLGLSYYATGRAADTIPLLEKAPEWYPRANVDAAYVLGACYMQTKDFVQARKAFARMLDVPPDSAASYMFTARILMRQQFEPLAVEYAQKAAELDPKLPLVHFLLGELYLANAPEKAIVELKKELAINPGHAPTYYKLADAYSRVQKYEEAEQLLQRSIWLDATSTGPYILLGKVLEKKGELDLAVRMLQRAAAMDPNNATTHYFLGQAYRDLGQKEQADSEFKLVQGLQGKPDSSQ